MRVRQYEIKPTTIIKMGFSAEVLCIQMQGDKAFMFVNVDPDEPTTEKHTYVCVPTGKDIQSTYKLDETSSVSYVGTFQVPCKPKDSPDGAPSLVFHVFEIL